MLQEPPSIVATPCQASVDTVCQWLKREWKRRDGIENVKDKRRDYRMRGEWIRLAHASSR